MRRTYASPALLGLFLIAACSGGTETTASATDGDTTGDTSTSTTSIATTTLTSSTSTSTSSSTSETTGGPTSTSGPTTDTTTATDTGSTTEPATSTTGEPAACDDQVMNGDETDVDCGGSCDPCADGLGCSVGQDCQSSACTDNVCTPPACDDGAFNGDETDVDCGGSCDPCADGLGCLAPFDCISGVCIDNICTGAACDDMLMNGAETDVDCGGGECAGCMDGQACAVGEDCMSGVCEGDTCIAGTCSDGVKNNDEEDVDCGGETCAPCILEGLIINEIDYDNVGNDIAEFVEIYNNTGDTVDLSGIHVILINGTNNQPYASIDLTVGGSLNQGQYLVVAPPPMMIPPEAVKVPFPADVNNIQNGNPDGIALVDIPNAKLLDALSYEGSMNAVNIPGIGMVSLVEGEPFPTADSNVSNISLARIPNGNDKNNAATDWATTNNITPGAANVP